MKSDRCQAYVQGRSVPLARGGRRYMQCKHTATAERTDTRQHWGGPVEREVRLCGIHVKLFDQGRRDMLVSDPRR